jgi:hypothetical protein
LSYYVIEHARGSLWWNGERWQRQERRAKVYAFDELPAELPIKNGADQVAEKTDARYRLGGRGGELVATCWPTLKRVVPEGTIEYGWICAACQHSNGSHLAKCEGCDTERGSG